MEKYKYTGNEQAILRFNREATSEPNTRSEYLDLSVQGGN